MRKNKTREAGADGTELTRWDNGLEKKVATEEKKWDIGEETWVRSEQN